jgi:hypothetical protein
MVRLQANLSSGCVGEGAMRRLGIGNVSENDTIIYENVSRTTCATISKDMNVLVEKGVMQRFGSGRGVYCELGLE